MFGGFYSYAGWHKEPLSKLQPCGLVMEETPEARQTVFLSLGTGLEGSLKCILPVWVTYFKWSKLWVSHHFSGEITCLLRMVHARVTIANVDTFSNKNLVSQFSSCALDSKQVSPVKQSFSLSSLPFLVRGSEDALEDSLRVL